MRTWPQLFLGDQHLAAVGMHPIRNTRAVEDTHDVGGIDLLTRAKQRFEGGLVAPHEKQHHCRNGRRDQQEWRQALGEARPGAACLAPARARTAATSDLNEVIAGILQLQLQQFVHRPRDLVAHLHEQRK